MIILHSVDVALAGNTVLHDLDWQLRPGEHWAIIGAIGLKKAAEARRFVLLYFFSLVYFLMRGEC